MFKLVSKIYNGNIQIGYEVLDESNKSRIITIENAQGLAMMNGIENVVFNNRTRSLNGTNGNDLRTLPRKQQKVTKQNSSEYSNIFYGKELANILTTENYKERWIMQDLMKFLENPCNGKICALYGLRRTGKTTMMLQAIKKMYPTNPKSIAYITLNENNDLASLYKEIDKLIKKGIKYIFIDEITSVNGFIQSAARLADIYARQGVHIVIAGTDSYILELAGRDNLYDRVVKISTTYIGYKEYAYLVEGSDLLDYIHNGGTLKADAFYDVKRTNEYVDTSISNNIINSLIRANNLKEHSHLLELQGRGLLKKAIEQAIASANTELTTYVITEAYTNKDLGSAKQMMEQIFNIDSTLDTQEVEERVRYKLSIVKQFDATISNDYVEELREFLETLGVIKTYIRYVGRRKVAVPIFVQPGLRYNQTIELLNALFETQSFFDIPRSVREDFINKLVSDVEGNLIEHEVILNYLMKNVSMNI